jgi:hypothetical protein
MANPTSNFNWQMPTASDLVTDLPADFEVFGQAVDTALADLKGGTTGQVLSKTSGTDMDFTWVTTDDANAIQNAIVDAKGDLIAASANDTPARLAVGANGETLVADSSTATGLRWQGDYAAGKNKIINGDFNTWQRGASFSAISSGQYTSDRWLFQNGGNGTATISREAFTPGAAPIAGYEYPYFLQIATNTVGTSTNFDIAQRIEDVTTFAGQTVTLSFFAKADSTRTIDPFFGQNFGSGGSSSVFTFGTSITLTTSWARYTQTFTIPSISGKTIGTSSFLTMALRTTPAASAVISIFGVQVEAGLVATAFQTASGSIAGELALAQRYYYRLNAGASFSRFGAGMAFTSTASQIIVPFPVSMRTRPTALEQSGTAGNYATVRANSATDALTAVPAFNTSNLNSATVDLASANLVAGDATFLCDLSSNAYLGWSAEL